MSRPANPGTRAVLNARERLKQIETEIDELRAFLAQCERYANEMPAPEQPLLAGEAEQGNGSPGQSDNPSVAHPCSAEESGPEMPAFLDRSAESE